MLAGQIDDPGGDGAPLRGWAAPLERIDRIEVRFAGGTGALAPRLPVVRHDLLGAAPGIAPELCGFEVVPPDGTTGGAAVRVVVDGIAEPLPGSAATTGTWTVAATAGPRIDLGPCRRSGRIEGLARAGLEDRWPVIACSGRVAAPGAAAEVLLAVARLAPVLPSAAVVLIGPEPGDDDGWVRLLALAGSLDAERWLRVTSTDSVVPWRTIADVVIDASSGGPCDVAVVADRVHSTILRSRGRWPIAGVARRRARRTTRTTTDR